MSKLIKSTAIISFFTLFSRILGMIRDMVLMSVFGTGGMMDAFLIWALLLCKIVILQNHYPKKLPYDKFLKVI
jgi:hypothetical protein